MKILHVETGRHFYGGPQQVVYLMKALRDRGHENELVCPPGSGIDGAARAIGIPVSNLFCAGDLDLPFAYRLTQYINESKPDIVHCHSRRGADVLGGLAASFADVPAVVSRRVDNAEMRVVAALRYRPFKKIVAISAAVAGVLRDNGIEEDRISVIRSAVDAEAFARPAGCERLREEFAIADSAFLLATAGQLIPRKGHRFLLEALARIVEKEPRVQLIVFGEGELDAELRSETAGLGLNDHVQFAGFREDLDELVGCVDLLAHPALAEGLGVATLKAAAAGVAVVGFASGGLPEAVSDGETGILVPPEDIDALAGAITTLMNDDALRERMGAAGQGRMRDEFSIDVMADRHVELYESILDD